MHNPNSAIERVKNHLAYKLGQAMIDFANSSSGGGYIALFKKLYKIKKQHKKEQKIYQQTIQVFPQLKYPSLEACSDYEQALKYKFHLSYMLGEVLIKAYQNWYKGAGFKLKNNIKKANKEFQIFREIFKEFDQINSSILEGLIDNKQLFLKEFSRIKNILKIHQDYRAILDNIFHNFNYFIQNFDLIEEWLLSDDFKERYKKENHPYPSLLDPKKLNDKNEKINYHNIPAELAWEMNLPLPDNYEFVWLGGHGTGTEALKVFLSYNKIIIPDNFFNYETGLQRYKYALNILLNDIDHIKGIRLKDYHFNDFEKFCKLIQKKCKFIFQVRDYFEIFTCYINHRTRKSDAIMNFDLQTNLSDVFDRFYYFLSGENHPIRLNLKNFLSWPALHQEMGFRTCVMEYSMLQNFDNILDVLYIDIKDIIGVDTKNTIQKICNFINISYNQEYNYSENIIGDLKIIFPLTLNVLEGIELLIIDSHSTFDTNCYKDITLTITNSNVFKILIKLSDNLKLIDNIIKELKLYFFNFNKTLKQKLVQEKKIRIKEQQYIDIYKHDPYRRRKLQKMMSYELTHIKQHRPDIVASWKYYQEFEKMCKELDG
ncbi:DUF2972 domain-containing protein [Campylobacter jejuni]|nr:DUF2972 domain-containing protein [Campylobacter jejuni]EAI8351928.1 DUF2972 domain-containing protein [Campylobacter jejuni]EGH7312899.1 DUF2972 domain-containing protein [Campylobacter jejuni]EKN0146148.1 DUF2972 domain-containing protein [Campylobacter jejuni]HEC3034425.1 DUF2972 domain-containing protein [Campylobacter jejuni]